MIVTDMQAAAYQWHGIAYCAPRDVVKALARASPGETVDVYINSPGGSVPAGSEIYEALRSYKGTVRNHIVGQACSAASVVAMSGWCEMAPTAMMMVHRVSTDAHGNRNRMAQTLEMLDAADEAISSAYMEKTGMSREDVLQMMDHETWLSPEKAIERRLADAISERKNTVPSMVAIDGLMLSDEAIERAEKEIRNSQIHAAQAQLDLLRLKGDTV